MLCGNKKLWVSNRDCLFKNAYKLKQNYYGRIKFWKELRQFLRKNKEDNNSDIEAWNKVRVRKICVKQLVEDDLPNEWNQELNDKPCLYENFYAESVTRNPSESLD